MPEELPKTYNSTEVEDKIYKRWEDSGFFNPDNLPGERTEPYSIVLPPPNVTGILHMGSALMLAIEDILIRYARMNNKKALWIPGTDSAAIATQARVEKDISKKESKNRHDLGREELLKRIDRFVEENKATILSQIRAMGASVDWSRYAYTMDGIRYRAVMAAFIRMYEEGLIYRGNRIVNWDPKGQTTISDDEIVYEERKTKLYTFRYSKDFPVSIATTRPETKVGDTAVAVHPDDARYKKYVGKEYDLEFAGVSIHIKIIADKSVDPEFGTGALGVTPAHSTIDWEIAERHDLSKKQVINEYGRMTVGGENLLDKKVTEAREFVVQWLKENGLLEKEEEIIQNISTAQRTGGIIEPLPKLQWFVNVTKKIHGRNKTLKDIMRDPVASGEIKIIPEHSTKTYFHWIDNLRDWCISRQIWFGHRVPIWYRDQEIKCSIEKPAGEGWEQDPDVLDTWFSSALWTFSTLGWPDQTNDLATYHPTTILETGYDILFFWVARMIMMSGFHLKQVPFKTVYLHGLVRDEKGRKISKSLGNNIDPLKMIGKYGADAVRMSLIIGTTAGTDSKLSEPKIRGYRNFSNKLWNIARFILMSIPDSTEFQKSLLTTEDQKLIDDLAVVSQDITKDMEEFRFYMAGEKIYHYIWHAFADKIIEESKVKLTSEDPAIKASAQRMLLEILVTCLKLLHPFMPFITEEIYSKLQIPDKQLLMVEKWPE
ncbi:MAG: valine--tRNA ligase [Patescibacteria group bacterium]